MKWVLRTKNKIPYKYTAQKNNIYYSYLIPEKDTPFILNIFDNAETYPKRKLLLQEIFPKEEDLVSFAEEYAAKTKPQRFIVFK